MAMSLPIDAHLARLREAQASSPNLVLVAEPGAGKTTRVPRMLLEDSDAGEIWVLEPRRLAARMAARFVAAELGESIGGRVGYRVRFDDATGPRTRLVYMTEALLLRQLLHDPTLRRVRAVVFDEFHGRTLASDFGLATLRHLQRRSRPDLRLLVMSATLDAEPIAAFLGDAPVVRVPGRQHPVEIAHLPHKDTRPLESQVAGSVAAQVSAGLDGDVLVFLPGMAEIRRAEGACQRLADRHDLMVVPLHGSLEPGEQDRAVKPAARRKVILSTNVAETSVTIDGVVAVIDSGLAREASHDPWSGIATLRLGAISQAAATQRAGRAGRTRPGRCQRLYTLVDYKNRPAHSPPEAQRLDLTEMTLLLAALGLPPLAALPCVEPPPQAAAAAAHALLTRLGALVDGGLTPLGRKLASLPLHPRLGRLILAADAVGQPRIGCAAAARLSEEEGPGFGAVARTLAPSDVELLLLKDAAHETRALEGQLARLVGADSGGRRGRPSAAEEDALARAILAAFPDRVARRLPPLGHRDGELELQLAGGGRAYLSPASAVRDAEFLVAVAAQSRQATGRPRTLVHVAQAISPDWLLEDETGALQEEDTVAWNGAQERVERVSRITYDGLVLDESRSLDVPEALATPALQAAARTRGAEAFVDREVYEAWRARVLFVQGQDASLRLVDPEADGLDAALAALCAGKRSFAELRADNLLAALEAGWPPGAHAALARLAPTHVTLPGGRRLAVHYERDKPPWVESWLQDFFGSARGPTVANGRVPLTLHLLAPNRRPVQVTSDLAGFWQRHYPELKKALSRRYPRHAWPDDPTTAAPPAPAQRGRKG
jgi:ATP-dependent helicase HrpB